MVLTAAAVGPGRTCRQHEGTPVVTPITQTLRWLSAAVGHPRRTAVVVTGLGLLTGLIAGPAVAHMADAPTPADTPAPAGTAAAAAPSAEPTAEPQPPHAPAAKTLRHEFQFQPNYYYYCGPAATRIALTALGAHPDQDEIARRLGTTTSGTDSVRDTTRVLNSLGRTDAYHSTFIPGTSATQAETDRLRADVVRAVSHGHPVVANVVGAATDTDGDTHSYPGGHYLTVVGYREDGRIVRLADPADVVGGGSYEMTVPALADWIAQRGYSA